jgi:hypothetical protein
MPGGGFEYDPGMTSGAGASLAGPGAGIQLHHVREADSWTSRTVTDWVGARNRDQREERDLDHLQRQPDGGVGQPNYSTLTVNYTDEWSLDGYDAYVKVNNGSPVFFSQGIWTNTPGPGSPLPPPANNPGDQFPAYPNAGNPGSYTIAAGTDWTYTIPNSNNATIEMKGSWTWGHQNDITGASSGNYTAQMLYTFPNPTGNFVSITVFLLDGDHCGDYAYANYTFKNTGLPGAGSQTIGSVGLVQ